MTQKSKELNFLDDDDAELLFDSDEDEINLLVDDRKVAPKLAADTSSPAPLRMQGLAMPLDISSNAPWKVMVVDDDAEVHAMTHLALRGFKFNNKPLKLISAHSAREAAEVIEAHADTALILLDVVMEEKDSGLQLVKYIREDLGNQLVRIILRTGQPGEAPEESVIVNYNINEYKTKTELTHAKLFTTMIATLRSYQDVITIEAHRRQLSDQAIALQQEIIIRRQIEEALFDSMERIRLIANSVPVLISYVDSEQRYQFANKQYEEWFGLPATKIKGMHIKDLEGKVTYEKMKESIETALWGEEVTFDTVVTMKGEERQVRVTYVPHFDKEGQVLGFFSLMQNLFEMMK